jgi:hypothetical protein
MGVGNNDRIPDKPPTIKALWLVACFLIPGNTKGKGYINKPKKSLEETDNQEVFHQNKRKRVPTETTKSRTGTRNAEKSHNPIILIDIGGYKSSTPNCDK